MTIIGALDIGNGVMVDPSSLPHAYGYNGDGTLATDTVTVGDRTWVKTYTYTAGNLTSETGWVRQ